MKRPGLQPAAQKMKKKSLSRAKGFPSGKKSTAKSVQEVRVAKAQSGRFPKERKQGEGFISSGKISEIQEKIHWSYEGL